MRKLTVAAGCLAVIGAGWCFGSQHAAKTLPGGSTWKEVQESERQTYVVGFMQGYVLGARDAGSSTIAKFAKDRLPSMTPAAKKDFEEGIDEAQKAAPTIVQTSALILTAAVSTFYGDEQNAPVCWEKAVTLSAASLGGNTATEQELVAARKKGAEKGCR